MEGTINTPLKGTNNYVQNKTSENSKKLQSWRGQQIPHLLHNFLTLSSIQQWTLGEGVMILAYLGQTPEVPRTDLRAKHHSYFSIATLIIQYNGLTMSINSATTSSVP